MLPITIPRTTLVTSRLGFGTATLHHLLTARQRLQVLSAAYDQGITHFDTAPMYGEGMAERTLGIFLSGGRREQVTIATKVGIPSRVVPELFPPWMYLEKAAETASRRLGFPRVSRRRRALMPRDVEKSFIKSLRSLRTDVVDMLFVHEPACSEISSIARLADWLSLQKRAGRVRYTGLAGTAAACVAITRELPEVFDILQVEDSLGGHEADALTAAGLPLQITYGYLRLARHHDIGADPTVDLPKCMAGALARNPDGVILVSSRRVTRVVELAQFAAQWSAPSDS